MKNNLIGISGRLGSGKDLVGNIINYLSQEHNWDSFEHYMAESGQNNDHYRIKKYADSLKNIVCLLIGCTREQLEDREFKETPLSKKWSVYSLLSYNEEVFKMNVSYTELTTTHKEIYKEDRYREVTMTPRRMLQLLGTECGRNIIHPEIWTNALFSTYVPIDPEKARNLGNILDYSDCTWPSWIITDMRFPNELIHITDREGITIRVNRPSLEVKEGKLHASETALDNEEFTHVITNDGTIEDLVEKVRNLKII